MNYLIRSFFDKHAGENASVVFLQALFVEVAKIEAILRSEGDDGIDKRFSPEDKNFDASGLQFDKPSPDWAFRIGFDVRSEADLARELKQFTEQCLAVEDQVRSLAREEDLSAFRTLMQLWRQTVGIYANASRMFYGQGVSDPVEDVLGVSLSLVAARNNPAGLQLALDKLFEQVKDVALIQGTEGIRGLRKRHVDSTRFDTTGLRSEARDNKQTPSSGASIVLSAGTKLQDLMEVLKPVISDKTKRKDSARRLMLALRTGMVKTHEDVFKILGPEISLERIKAVFEISSAAPRPPPSAQRPAPKKSPSWTLRNFVLVIGVGIIAAGVLFDRFQPSKISLNPGIIHGIYSDHAEEKTRSLELYRGVLNAAIRKKGAGHVTVISETGPDSYPPSYIRAPVQAKHPEARDLPWKEWLKRYATELAESVDRFNANSMRAVEMNARGYLEVKAKMNATGWGRDEAKILLETGVHVEAEGVGGESWVLWEEQPEYFLDAL
jgi:hypothetical protein